MVGLIDPRTLVEDRELALSETADIALLLRVSLPIMRCPYHRLTGRLALQAKRRHVIMVPHDGVRVESRAKPAARAAWL